MNISIETITPQAASEILAHSMSKGFVNRPLAKKTIEAYAQDMKMGKWQFNGDPIRISPYGELLDGQHRLQAIIRTGLPQEILVARGIEKDTFTTIDRGRTRTLSDLLYIDGHTRYTSRLSPAAKAIYQYLIHGQYATKIPNLHVDIIRAVVGIYEKRILEAAEFHERFMNRPLITCSVMTSLFVFFNIVSSSDVFDFFEGLLGGANLSENDPRFLARNRLLEMRSRCGRVVPNQAVEAAFVILAWNKFRQGETAKLLRWNRENGFPQILGLPVKELKAELEAIQ